MEQLITSYGYNYDDTLSIVDNIKNTLELIKNSSCIKYQAKRVFNIKVRYAYQKQPLFLF